MKSLVLIVLLAWACLCVVVPAAQPAEVTPGLVCAVQRAIRWSRPPWKEERCAAVAAALNEARQPDVMLAIGVLESHLRPDAVRWARCGGVDRPADPSARAAWCSGCGKPGDVVDVGLMGVRCVLGEAGRCAVGPARGWTLRSLRDPVTSARVAEAVLEAWRRAAGERALSRYGGDLSGKNKYGRKVAAIVAALEGRESRSRSRRVRDLARLIAAATPKR